MMMGAIPVPPVALAVTRGRGVHDQERDHQQGEGHDEGDLHGEGRLRREWMLRAKERKTFLRKRKK